MTAEQTAQNIMHKIDELAAAISDEVEVIRMQPGAWGTEETRRRRISDSACKVLVDWLLGKRT